jgi:hypothetical protein
MYLATGMIRPRTLCPLTISPRHFLLTFLRPHTFHPRKRHNKQNYTNPLIGWAFSLTEPNPG